ncbi:hypothetical protein [Microbacterium sp. NPDC056052]|uniref:hypothetical protein n=1 Tax=Microbacterium sp. NPDC056052 TaxID=3345695 RepID=UPI0035E1D33D
MTAAQTTETPEPARAAASGSETHGNDARARVREPFKPGNTAAVTHGAYSASKVAEVAEEIEAEAMDAFPLLSLDKFRWARRSWAHAEARCQLIRADLDSVGLKNRRGTYRASLLTLLHAEERRAEKGRNALGLSPDSIARIVMNLRSAGTAVLSPDEQKEIGL